MASDQLMGNDIKRVIFSWEGDKVAPDRHCTLVGTFKQIVVRHTCLRTHTYVHAQRTLSGVDLRRNLIETVFFHCKLRRL